MEDNNGEGEKKRNVKISRQQHFPDHLKKKERKV
jgi:hypothetical protein